MIHLRELFRINYKHRKIIVLLDNNNRKVFLEIQSNGTLGCPPMEDFIELYKIYNIKDGILYDIDKSKQNFTNEDEKTSNKSSFIIPLTIYIIILTLMNVYQYQYNNITYSQRLAILSTQYEENPTKEDVISAIDNNPYLSPKYKRFAKEVLDIFLIKDPNMNLRVYYENIKTLHIKDNLSLAEINSISPFVHNIAGCYVPRENTIYLVAGATTNTIKHELAHAGHHCVRWPITITESYAALDESMNNRMIAPPNPVYQSYITEEEALNFFLLNLGGSYNYHSYTEAGATELVRQLKEKYPNVDIDYLIEFLDANITTKDKLCQQTYLPNTRKYLDELFKLAISPPTAEELVPSYQRFEDYVINVCKYEGCSNEEVCEVINHYKWQFSNILNCIIYRDKNFYIGNENYYFDYEGNKVECQESDYIIRFNDGLVDFFTTFPSQEDLPPFFKEEMVRKVFLYNGPIGAIYQKDSKMVTEAAIIEILNAIYDSSIKKDESTYDQLYWDYWDFSIVYSHIEDVLWENNINLEDLLKKRNLNYLVKMQETAKELGLLNEDNKVEILSPEIKGIIEIDGHYYPSTTYSISGERSEISWNNNDVIKRTYILSYPPLTFYSFNPDYNLEYHSVSNKKVNIYGFDDGPERAGFFKTYFKKHRQKKLDQESIQKILSDTGLLEESNYRKKYSPIASEYMADKKPADSIYIEFGTTKEGKFVYRIKEEENVIYEPVKGGEYKTKLPCKDLLNKDPIKIKNSIKEDLSDSQLKIALMDISNYLDTNLDLNSFKYMPEISSKSMKAIVDGKEYNVEDILVNFDRYSKKLAIYYSDGTAYPISIKALLNDYQDTRNFYYSHYLDYYIEKYKISLAKEISLNELVELITSDFQKEITTNNNYLYEPILKR